MRILDYSLYSAWGINISACHPTQLVLSELSESKDVQISDYIELGHANAGHVCQHLLHACGGQPLPLHDHQQGGPGLRLQHGGGQAEYQPGGLW